MSVKFIRANDQRYNVAALPIAAIWPFSVSVWFYPDIMPNTAPSEEAILFTISDGGFSDFFALRIDDASSTTQFLQFNGRFAGGTPEPASSSVEPTIGVWNHGFGMTGAAQTGPRTVVLNGNWAGRGTNTNDLGGQPVVTETQLGMATTGDDPFDGKLAEVAIWNVELVQPEVEALSRGWLPTDIRPQNLVDYWSMRTPNVKELKDGIGNLTLFALGVSGLPTFSGLHPSMLRPVHRPIGRAPDVVPVGGNQAAIMIGL